MAYVAIAAAVVGAIGTMKQGAAQKAMYDAQATQTMVQARSNVIKSRREALKYKQDGVAVLDKMRKTIATVSARGAAGSIDPFSGSTGNLQVNIFDQGYLDFSINKDNTNMARENMNIIQKSAEYQAGIYRAAGAAAKQAATFKAISSVGMAVAGAYGGFGGGSAGSGMGSAGQSTSQFVSGYGAPIGGGPAGFSPGGSGYSTI
tara:strand:+ start:680 stop:1291 length:612 start_codon:yes stop_codon:yes gene_type:complete